MVFIYAMCFDCSASRGRPEFNNLMVLTDPAEREQICADGIQQETSI